MTAVVILGRFTLFVGSILAAGVSKPPPAGQTFAHAYSIGVRSLPILLIICGFIGTNLSLQGYSAFIPMGGERLVGLFVALAGVKELAPILAASMVAAKAGTEMASQIAVMRVREQIDALEVMAVNPQWYLVVPRFLGILLVMPALTIISTFVMVMAAYAAAVYQLGINGADFLEYAEGAITAWDLVFAMGKGVLFGAIICLVSCYNGFRSAPGPRGVGVATNRAVVVSAVTCVIINYFVSEFLYG